MKKLFLPIIYFLLVVIFFWQFFLKGLLPIPSDTIVGLYYPFRDIYAKTNPNGIPFKNFLITDPVRQQYPWKYLSIEQKKNNILPTWNPYNFSGTLLLANFQSSVFYPLNFLFFLAPFEISWSLFIFLQPVLAGFFLYFYLNNLKLKKFSSLLGAIAFSFSGFSIAWLEWGTILNTVLWLPLALLSVDKLFTLFEKENLLNKNISIWSIVFVLSLAFSFFAGHLQTFFYLIVLLFFYMLSKLICRKEKVKKTAFFTFLFAFFVIISIPQWFPTLKFISMSARSLDVIGWQAEGWFIPWQNMIQFLAPDFFGNPATLNYYGIWNYTEFIGYVGIIPLVLAFLALFFRKDKKTMFFGSFFFVSLIFAFPSVISKIPYKLEIPLISTSQPTRLLFLTDFSLSILAALGLDYFIRVKNKKNILYILLVISLFFISLWGFVLFSNGQVISLENLSVARQNLILPCIIFLTSLILFLILVFYKNKKILNYFLIVLIAITVFDLFRFGLKFETFSKKEYLFPNTAVTEFLKEQNGYFRVMSTDPSIFPPNFSIMYKIQTLDGYDPLYLQRYGELMAAVGRGKPDILPPFGFNRIITPQNVSSRIMDLLGVKYVLSFNELTESKLSEVYRNGKIIVYENNNAYPKVFFVVNTKLVESKQEAINEMFNIDNPLEKTAIVEGVKDKSFFKSNWDLGKIEIKSYQENKIILNTQCQGDGFLVLTDSYYPTWSATIDGKNTEIYITDYSFRGIIVPKGNHKIEFKNSLF